MQSVVTRYIYHKLEVNSVQKLEHFHVMVSTKTQCEKGITRLFGRNFP